MTSEYDYETTFTFRKTNKFWVELNKKMVIKDRDTLNDYGNKKYHLLLFSSLPNDFNECIDEYGCLRTDTTSSDYPQALVPIESGYTDVEFHLGVEWLDNGENGFNLFLDEWDSGGTAQEHTLIDVNIAIDDGTELMVKGVALAKTQGTDSGSNYIVAYARASSPVKCQNYITLMKGSSFVGHNSCEVA